MMMASSKSSESALRKRWKWNSKLNYYYNNDDKDDSSSAATMAIKETSEHSNERRERSITIKPDLRRAGSSLGLSDDVDYSSSEEEEEEAEAKKDESQKTKAKMPHQLLQQRTICNDDESIIGHMRNTFMKQLEGLTNDFQKNGLPWDGYQCRSVWAGCSGILYALPSILLPNMQFVERMMWIIQSMLSILADYCHIHQDSIWHGIDRIFATFNAVATLWRASFVLDYKCVMLLLILPMGSYIAANRAKKHMKLTEWHWCHTAWHITSSFVVTIVVYLIGYCPKYDHHEAGHISLESMCYRNS